MLASLQIRETNLKIFHHYLLGFTNIQWDVLDRSYNPYSTDEETKAQRGCNQPMKIPAANFLTPTTPARDYMTWLLPIPWNGGG